MLSRSERILENIPVGSLGIIPLLGCEELGNKVNDYLVKWRRVSVLVKPKVSLENPYVERIYT